MFNLGFVFLAIVGLSFGQVFIPDASDDRASVEGLSRDGTSVARCGTTSDLGPNQRVILASPNFPSRYSGDTRCGHTFVVSAATVVRVNCFFMRLSGTRASGTGDRLNIYINGDLGRRSFFERDRPRGSVTAGSSDYPLLFELFAFPSNPRFFRRGYVCLLTTTPGTPSPTPPPPPPTPAPPPGPTPAPTPAPPADNCRCGVANAGGRIVGGTATGQGEYPWMASLRSPRGSHFCGGSVLNNRYILTAAHCIGSSTFRVTVGDHMLNGVQTPEQTLTVNRVIRHPNYNRRTSNNDFALVRTDQSIRFTRDVRAVCLPSSSGDCQGRTAIVTGWGATSEGGRGSNTLLEVEVPFVTQGTCNAAYGGITNNMICYGTAGKDSCQGDSGGPLFVEENSDQFCQIGVVSFGIGCARRGFPGVYSRVDSVLPWINGIIRDGYETCPAP